jgi:glutamyl-tRNA synthetase
MSVRVRIAPSPTGYFHFGLARTALYNYLFAKKMGGAMVLRIEDTDKDRGKKEFEDDIYECFEWLGISFDEKYVQSQHIERHKELLKKIVAEDKAYVSKEEAKDGSGRVVEVVRLRNPGQSITFTDVIRGDITFDTTELKDFVIARSIDDPLYHFAVVADDGDAGITHVIRGEDHISNTPRQILIQEALGFPRPVYAHLPLILAPDRTKMSKRKHQTAMREFRKQGYLPEALINFTALLGWSEGKGDKEIYSMEELIKAFSLEGIHKSGAVFDVEKLRWFNRHYLLQKTPTVEILNIMKTELEERGVPWDDRRAAALVPMALERISVLEDLRMLIKDGEFDFFFSAPSLEASRVPEKKSTPADAKEHLSFAASALAGLEDFSAASVKAVLWDYATEKGRGAVLWPIRYALSGRDKSPDPFAIAEIIGKDATLERIRAAGELV